MAKIMALIPCLMLPNNRSFNLKAMKETRDLLGLDCCAVYDQCFSDTDYTELYGFEYIAHSTERMGWVEPRNKLLEHFYNSDFDYAFWIDANSTVSKPTLNDLLTIIKAVQEDRLSDVDAIFSTLGIWVSQDRIKYKSASDYFDNVHLIPTRNNKSYNWMHGLLHKNFKKYYNQEFYIDSRCDTRKGTPDDVYFARVLQKYTASYVAPTVVINKPNSKASCTWANSKGTYDYPPVLFDELDGYILENTETFGYHITNKSVLREVVLPRVETGKSEIKPYTPRSKKTTEQKEYPKVSLF